MASCPGEPLPIPHPSRPIVLIGAGGIVVDAHLPAYRIAGFSVISVHDLDFGKAKAVAQSFGIARVGRTLEETVREAPPEAVFDVAVPASALSTVLAALPDGSAVLIQKPFGENLGQARQLLALCRRKKLRATVNFQLRYAPYIRAARAAIDRGAIGAIHDVEVRVTVYTPWELWKFLEASPRVEILYHSIHYVDLIRSFLGEPRGVYAKTVRHPRVPRLASTATNLALDYGDLLRANITTNHGHNFGPKHQESYVKWEGSKGAIVARLGLLLDYPKGAPDALEICTIDAEGKPGGWQEIPVQGSWYPHAFIGTMGELMRFANGEIPPPATHVEDAIKTMAVVEAAHESSASGAVPIPLP